jgi:lipopolysaccharide export system permease protein
LSQSFLIPLVEREANELRARSLVETDIDKSGELEFWTRSENHFVRVNDVRFGRLLTDVEVFSMDKNGRLKQIIQASRASITGIDDWLLRDVLVTSIEGPVVREQQRDEMRWPGLLSTEQAAILVMPLEALAPLDLWRLTDFQNQNGLDSHRYRVVLWQQLSIAVAVVGMALLALPLLLGSIRTVPASQRIVIGGFIGIGFYLLQQLSGHFSGLFGLNPASTIMTPSMVLLAAAIYAQFLEAGRKRRAIRRADKKPGTA